MLKKNYLRATLIISLLFTCSIWAVPGTLKWTLNLDASPSGQAILGANNTIYVTTADHISSVHLWAVDANTGTKKWAAFFNSTNISAPAVDQKTGNIVVSMNPSEQDPGQIVIVDPQGNTINKITLDNLRIVDPTDPSKSYVGLGWAGQPAVQSSTGYIYVPVIEKCTSCTSITYVSELGVYDQTGKFLQWQTIPALFIDLLPGVVDTLPQTSFCVPTGNYISCNLTLGYLPNQKNLHTVNIFDGLTNLYMGGSGSYTPLMGSQDAAIWTYANDLGYLIRLIAPAETAWQQKLGDNITLTPSVYDRTNRIYVGASNGMIFIYNADGTSVNVINVDSIGISRALAIVPDGSIIYATLNDGTLMAVDARSSTKLWVLSIGVNSSPILDAQGTIYVTSAFGALYAVNGQ